MKTPVFVAFCLVLCAAIMSMHVFFKDSFTPEDLLKTRISKLERQRDDAELKSQLVASELAEYQQSVATLIPSAMRSQSEQAAFPLRQLASVAAQGFSVLQIERASGVFENAKAAFRDKDFNRSSQMLNQLVENYPASEHLPEAEFLLAEGRFQLGDYAASVRTIETMVRVFPENELTGYALMRLGKIFEKQNRIEDAGDIYRAVLANFKQPALLQQADASLKAVEL